MKVAIYARVSTKEKTSCPICAKIVRVIDSRLKAHQNRSFKPCAGSGAILAEEVDKGQDTENQLLQLREYCARLSWTLVGEFIDRETAKHSNRDEFTRLFDCASRKEFDVVLVWALDRFTREGIPQTFEHVGKLTRYGVQFESYTEPQFRTSAGPTAELMLAIAAWMAKQERQRISDRTKAGVARAKSQGKHCGRPTRVFRRDRALELRNSGMSWRALEAKLGVPQATLRRALAGAE